MARVSNARSSPVERWVVPAARELLIQEACKGVSTKSLEEVAIIEMGQSPDGNSVNSDGAGTPFIGGPADLGIEFPETSRWTMTPTKLSQLDDIIVCVRATIGEPRWSDGVYCLGRGVAGVRPKDAKIDRKFLFRIIQANERLLFEKGTGTTFKTITKDHLAQIEVPILSPETQKMIGEYLEWLESHSKTRPDFSIAPKLPDFLNRASAIVAHIESLAARVNEARRLREETERESDALVSAGTKQLFNNHSWKMVSIEELVGREYLKNGKSLKSDEQPSEVSCLRISALRNGKIDCRDTKPISITVEDAKPYIIQKDDVYIVRGNGSKDLVGRAGVVEEYKGVIIFPDLFIKVPLNTDQILPAFFVAWWNSPAMREKIVDLAKTTSGIWKINQGHIASCEIPIPPLDEQQRILAYLDGLQAKVNALRELQSTSREELSALMSSVLDRAFKGEL